MDVSFQEITSVLLRRWWVVVCCVLLAVTLAYGVTSRQTPKYAAQATMRVYPVQPDGAIDYNALLFAERLAQTYQRLITIRPVLESVIEDLGLSYTVEELRGSVTAQVQADSELLLVSVSDTDPDRAAAIANEIAQQFSTYMTAQSATVGLVATEELQERVTSMDDRIDQIELQILSLASSPNSGDPVVQNLVAFLQGTLADLQPVRDQLRLALEASTSSGTTVDAQIAIAEPAIAPESPYAPRLLLNLVLGGAVGAMLASALLVGLVYVDRSVRSTTDLWELGELEQLATIGVNAQAARGLGQLFITSQPNGQAAEAIRRLRTNIEFASGEREIATLAISSPAYGEGKTTVAANLAAAIAEAGFATLVVDTNLRRPGLHTAFGMRNERGLSEVLGAAALPWTDCVRPTDIPSLSILTGGASADNAGDLLSGDRLLAIIDEMKGIYSVVVFDSAPLLPVSDAMIVAYRSDAVVLVARSGRTRVDDLLKASAMLRRGAVRIIGVAINRESRLPQVGHLDSDATVANPAFAEANQGAYGSDDHVRNLPNRRPTFGLGRSRTMPLASRPVAVGNGSKAMDGRVG